MLARDPCEFWTSNDFKWLKLNTHVVGAPENSEKSFIWPKLLANLVKLYVFKKKLKRINLWTFNPGQKKGLQCWVGLTLDWVKVGFGKAYLEIFHGFYVHDCSRGELLRQKDGKTFGAARSIKNALVVFCIFFFTWLQMFFNFFFGNF